MNMEQTQREIVEEFEAFPDWEERYRHIIALGARLPRLPEEYRRDKYLIEGCQSQVWLHAALEEGKVMLEADSDAMIVRGLVALMLRVFSGRTPDEILNTRPEFIDRIGMSRHLSPTRANGLAAMLKQVRMYAVAFKALIDRGTGNNRRDGR